MYIGDSVKLILLYNYIGCDSYEAPNMAHGAYF